MDIENIDLKNYLIIFFILLLVIQAVTMTVLLIRKFRLNPARDIKTKATITSKRTKNVLIAMIENFFSFLGKIFRS